MSTFGLAAHPLVRWLIASDEGVYDGVRTFLAGAADRDYLDIAGPPTDEDRAHAIKGGARSTPLPNVRLIMRPAMNAVTGEQGVEVVCSDQDLVEILRWHRQSLAQKRSLAS